MAKSDVMREILIRKVRDHRDKGSTRSSLDILGDKKDIWRELDQGPTQNPMHISEDEEEAVIARQFSPMIEELANKVFECFKKRRFEESSNEQSNEIEGILQSVNDGESRKRIVNWRHTEVTSSCSHDSMSSLAGLGGKVEGRMDSSACGG